MRHDHSMCVTLALFISLACVSSLAAQPSLPLVDDVDAAKFAEHASGLLAAMKPLKLGPTSALENDLKDLKDAKDKGEAVNAIQKRLDACCLLGITINPESRVKVARGPVAAVLVKDTDVYFLAKVNNGGGVTSALVLSGPQIVSGSEGGGGRWLEAEVVDGPSRKLTGEPLQYVIVRLRARESGKREATLCCDVGQGTQDLGFRAEVPILFVVNER